MTEATIIHHVRQACVFRDGYCRLAKFVGAGACRGPSEWAHFDKWKRWKTMGQDPEQRHCTQGSLMLCQRHHLFYDGKFPRLNERKAFTLLIEALSDRYADGPLAFTFNGVRYEEAA